MKRKFHAVVFATVVTAAAVTAQVAHAQLTSVTFSTTAGNVTLNRSGGGTGFTPSVTAYTGSYPFLKDGTTQSTQVLNMAIAFSSVTSFTVTLPGGGDGLRSIGGSLIDTRAGATLRFIPVMGDVFGTWTITLAFGTKTYTFTMTREEGVQPPLTEEVRNFAVHRVSATAARLIFSQSSDDFRYRAGTVAAGVTTWVTAHGGDPGKRITLSSLVPGESFPINLSNLTGLTNLNQLVFQMSLIPAGLTDTAKFNERAGPWSDALAAATLSTDNQLASLTIADAGNSGVTLTPHSGTCTLTSLTCTVTLARSTGTLTFTPVPRSDKALLVRVSSSADSTALIPPDAASTPVVITVVSESAEARRYTLTASRTLSADNTLRSFVVSAGGATAAVSGGTCTGASVTCALSVERGIDRVSISPTPTDSAATADVQGDPNNDGVVTLTLGQTAEIETVVTAQNGATKTYTLNATRKPARFSLDVNDDDNSDWRDGVLIVRHLFGFKNAELIRNAISAHARNDTAAKVVTDIEAARTGGHLDADGGGVSVHDGMLIARFLMGAREGGLTDGLTDAAADTVAATVRTARDNATRDGL